MRDRPFSGIPAPGVEIEACRGEAAFDDLVRRWHATGPTVSDHPKVKKEADEKDLRWQRIDHEKRKATSKQTKKKDEGASGVEGRGEVQ